MAKISLDDIDKYSKGGGSYFKLKDGESKQVRFLFNTAEECSDAIYAVHEFSGPSYATIDCSRVDGAALDSCKWCAMGNNPVARVILPIYEQDTNQITYWKRTASWMRNTLLPLLQNLQPGMPISGQTFIISRRGSSMQDTVYTIAPNMSLPNDNKSKNSFGEILDPYTSNMIRPNNYEFDPNKAKTSNSDSSNIPKATRSTAGFF